MTEEICHLCGGKMKKGFTEMKLNVDDKILVIKNIPADVCECCDEALITPEISDKISQTVADYRAGKLLTKPVTAAEVALEAA